MGRDKSEITKVFNNYSELRYNPHTLDCLMFTNKFWLDFYGFEYAPHVLGKYTIRTTDKEFQDLLGYPTVDEALDSKLESCKFPPRGALVKSGSDSFLGMKLGICVGTKVAYISRHGIVYENLDLTNRSWINKDTF